MARRRIRHRHAPGRAARRLTVTVAALLVVVAVAVGVGAQMGAASRPYQTAVNRSYAALAASAVRRSNADGLTLRTTIAGAPADERQVLFGDLDSLAAETASTARQLDFATPPDPSGGAGALCQAALDGRASTVASLRSAVEGLLGGPAGDAGSDGGETHVAELLAADGAQFQLADREFARCGQILADAPGSAHLPASTWVTKPSTWSALALVALVRSLVAAPSLVAVHRLTVEATSLDPTPLSTSGQVVVPATTTLEPSLVVANGGNVDESGVVVTVRAQPFTARAIRSSTHVTVGVAWGASRALTLPALPVTAGAIYVVTFEVTPRSGSVSTSLVAVRIAEFPTTATLTSSVPGPVAAGARVTYTAVVSTGAAAAPAVTGTVVFDDDGVPLPGCTVRLSGGQATCTASFTELGIHPISATYEGTSGLASTTSPLVNQTVGPAPAPSHHATSTSSGG